MFKIEVIYKQFIKLQTKQKTFLLLLTFLFI